MIEERETIVEITQNDIDEIKKSCEGQGLVCAISLEFISGKVGQAKNEKAFFQYDNLVEAVSRYSIDPSSKEPCLVNDIYDASDEYFVRVEEVIKKYYQEKGIDDESIIQAYSLAFRKSQNILLRSERSSLRLAQENDRQTLLKNSWDQRNYGYLFEHIEDDNYGLKEKLAKVVEEIKFHDIVNENSSLLHNSFSEKLFIDAAELLLQSKELMDVAWSNQESEIQEQYNLFNKKADTYVNNYAPKMNVISQVVRELKSAFIGTLTGSILGFFVGAILGGLFLSGIGFAISFAVVAIPATIFVVLSVREKERYHSAPVLFSRPNLLQREACVYNFTQELRKDANTHPSVSGRLSIS